MTLFCADETDALSKDSELDAVDVVAERYVLSFVAPSVKPKPTKGCEFSDTTENIPLLLALALTSILEVESGRCFISPANPKPTKESGFTEPGTKDVIPLLLLAVES